MNKTLLSIARRLFILPLMASAASAQYSSRIGVETGARIRVVAPRIFPERTTGTMLSAQNDTLVMARSGGMVSLAVPVDAIDQLEVSDGRNRAKWAGLGALAGLLGGGILGGYVGGQDDSSGWGATAGFFAGSIFGLGGGAIAGALAAPERWVTYSLRRYR